MKFRFITLSLLVLITLLACKAGPTYSNEGSPSNPVLLTVGNTHSGTIGIFGESFYKFLAVASASHTIALTNMQSDLDWYLYDDASYSNRIDLCDELYGPIDEIKSTVSLTNGVTYYLSVWEWDYIDGTFDLKITYP